MTERLSMQAHWLVFSAKGKTPNILSRYAFGVACDFGMLQKRKLSAGKLMLLNCGVGEDLRVPWTARRSNQSILKDERPVPICIPPCTEL